MFQKEYRNEFQQKHHEHTNNIIIYSFNNTYVNNEQRTTKSHDTNMVEDIIYATESTRTLITRHVIDEMREMSRMSTHNQIYVVCTFTQ